MMRKVCDYAKANDILVAIEALQPDESVLVNSVEQLKAYLDAVNHPQLKVCIDSGAMARVNNTIQDYVDAFMPSVEAGVPIICCCITTYFSGLKLGVTSLSKTRSSPP